MPRRSWRLRTCSSPVACSSVTQRTGRPPIRRPVMAPTPGTPGLAAELCASHGHGSVVIVPSAGQVGKVFGNAGTEKLGLMAPGGSKVRRPVFGPTVLHGQPALDCPASAIKQDAAALVRDCDA